MKDGDRWEVPDDRPPWEWRRLYRQAHNLELAAARAGLSDREAVKVVRQLGITNRTQPRFIGKLQPEDLGLSPLGCAECGTEEIGVHPCPDCGHDPRDDKKARFQRAYLDLLDDANGALPESVLLELAADVGHGGEAERRRAHFLKELERSGHVERVDEDPVRYKLAERERERTDKRPRVTVKV